MIPVQLSEYDTVGLVCWSFRAPVRDVLRHSANRDLKNCLTSRLGRHGRHWTSRSHPETSGTRRLMDEGEAGDTIYIPESYVARASRDASIMVTGYEQHAQRMRLYLN
ncbi:MAG: hypothetical protein AAGA56_03495, partial [Myxococcota bacterium]